MFRKFAALAAVAALMAACAELPISPAVTEGGSAVQAVGTMQTWPGNIQGNLFCNAINVANQFGPYVPGQSTPSWLSFTVSQNGGSVDWNTGGVVVQVIAVHIGGGYNYYETNGETSGTISAVKPEGFSGAGSPAFSNFIACGGTPQPISASISGDGTYDERYTWSIAKSAPGGVVEVDAGTSATVDFTVTVTKSGPENENYAGTGTLTVQNPSWNSATVNSSSPCTISGPVAPGASESCTFSLSGETSLSGSVSTSNGSATPTGTASYSLANSLNASAALADAKAPSIDALLTSGGSWTASVTEGPYTTCGETTISNTATLVPSDGVEQSATATQDILVVNCAPPPPPMPNWCSPGFWKNAGSSAISTAHKETKYLSLYASSTITIKKGGNNNPSMFEVVSNPQMYGGTAANLAADFFSSHYVAGYVAGQRTLPDGSHNCVLITP
jgi:hypothetical protein